MDFQKMINVYCDILKGIPGFNSCSINIPDKQYPRPGADYPNEL